MANVRGGSPTKQVTINAPDKQGAQSSLGMKNSSQKGKLGDGLKSSGTSAQARPLSAQPSPSKGLTKVGGPLINNLMSEITSIRSGGNGDSDQGSKEDNLNQSQRPLLKSGGVLSENNAESADEPSEPGNAQSVPVDEAPSAQPLVPVNDGDPEWVDFQGVGADSVVVFNNEKELKEHYAILNKIEGVAGVVLKIKRLNETAMENILFAIEQSPNIITLRLEDAVITRNAATHLSNFLKLPTTIETFGLIQIKFEDSSDHKKVLDSISKNNKIKVLILQQNVYGDQTLGDYFKSIIQNCKGLREIDLSWSEFKKEMVFYVLLQSLKKSLVYIVKLRGLQIGKVEGLILQEFFMDNKTVVSLDLEHSFGSPEFFQFLRKLDTLCNIKQLYADGLGPELTSHMPAIGKAIGTNVKLEILSMKETRAKVPALIEFWRGLKTNRSLRVLNFEKSKCGDKVVAVISEYLQENGVILNDLNLNRNGISGKGMVSLAAGIKVNKSLKKLSLSRNDIEEDGLEAFSDALSTNKDLEDLNLSENQISNGGLIALSKCLPLNSSLKNLDLSKNAFGTPGLIPFCVELETNAGIVNLNLARNKDINEDENGVKRLAACLQFNSYIKILDLNGIKLQKVCLKQNFLPSLQQNVFIQQIHGKYSQGVLNEELADNEIIEKDIIGCLSKDTEYSRTLQLVMKNKRTDLLKPALKLIRCQNLEIVDFTSMTLTDDQMRMISSFIGENPALKKLILTQNIFITDYGMILLTEALRKNKNLQHLSLLGCIGITNVSLQTMHTLVRDQNMTLFKLEIEQDSEKIDKELAMQVTKEAFLNKSIQKDLKPKVYELTSKMYRIDFEPDAILIDNFDSVLKCWRILRPNNISVTNQNLEDEHLEKLSALILEHLQNHMIQMSLRINKIGDKGAEALSTFISKNERQFESLEISRNEISHIGGAKILEAMKKNTRISQLLIDFGNKLTPRIAKKLEDEVRANQNISLMVKTALSPDQPSFGCLEIKDKGPLFLRCCLKSVSELYVINLQLTDNIIGFDEVRKICKVLSKNAPLKVLNLSHNRLDPSCAQEIANALATNSNLLELDVSDNQIKDTGIATLILPLAKQKLRAFHSDKGIQGNTNIRLGKLVLTKNNHTHEALKHVYALLFADNNIVIDIDLPQNLQVQGGKNTVLPGAGTTSVGGMYMSSGSPLKLSPKKSQVAESAPKKNPMGLGRYSERVGVEKQQSPVKPKKIAAIFGLEKPKDSPENPLLKMMKKQLETSVHQIQDQSSVAPFNKDESLIKPVLADQEGGTQNGPDNFDIQREEGNEQNLGSSQFSIKKFLCGGNTGSNNFIKNFIQDLRENEIDARLFKCNENVLTKVESVSQKYITIFLYVSTFFFYLTALLVPLTEGDSSAGHKTEVFYYYLIYIIISSIFELVCIIYLQRMINDPEILRVNKFHLTKIFTGQLGRMDYFTDVLFLTQLYYSGYDLLLVIGLVIFVVAYLYLKCMPILLLRKDSNQMIENIERNCKLAYVTEHQALAVILDSFSLSNFQTVYGRTVTIPKIICSIKSFAEDLPQFLVQVFYIMFYSDKKNSMTSVVLSILMGLISFFMSIKSALYATSSAINVPKVEKKIRDRINDKHDEFLRLLEREKEAQLDEFRAKIKAEQEAEEKLKQEIIPQSFEEKLQQCESKRSFFLNGIPSSVDGSLQQMLLGAAQNQTRNKSITSYFKPSMAAGGTTSTLMPPADLDAQSAMSQLLATRHSSPPAKSRFGGILAQQKGLSMLGLQGPSQGQKKR